MLTNLTLRTIILVLGLSAGALSFRAKAEPFPEVAPVMSEENATLLAKLKKENRIRPMEFVRIAKPKKPFMMGCDPKEEGKNEYGESVCGSNEQPAHPVQIPRAFEMQTTEVTQAQWFELMGTNPSAFSEEGYCTGSFVAGLKVCPNHPVTLVSWNDVQDFIKRLNELKKNKRYVYRLPYEAEWEYAARAGTKTSYFCGNDPGCLEMYGISPDFNPGKCESCKGEPQPAATGSLLANAFGLYDMHGNVSEWVENCFTDYSDGLVRNITLPKDCDQAVIRGGNYWASGVGLRSAEREASYRDAVSFVTGFRLARISRPRLPVMQKTP